MSLLTSLIKLLAWMLPLPCLRSVLSPVLGLPFQLLILLTCSRLLQLTLRSSSLVIPWVGSFCWCFRVPIGFSILLEHPSPVWAWLASPLDLKLSSSSLSSGKPPPPIAWPGVGVFSQMFPDPTLPAIPTSVQLSCGVTQPLLCPWGPLSFWWSGTHALHTPNAYTA